MNEKIIVLDRDGVINYDSDAFIKSADEWIPVDGSLEAIARLKSAGWRVAVATNQSGIRRGYYSRATLSAMHLKMRMGLRELGSEGVDWISFSPYLSNDNSPSRKPNTGMLQSIEKALNVSLEGKPMVGDTLGDLQAARNHGMHPYLVKTGKGMKTLQAQPEFLESVPVFENLAQLVDHLLCK
ncbi:D-glycero-beta-D-manno-heptose 1,7-bisphosphate 7-phosphatase [Thiomicrorhabdus indica]|uniref:D-glycero-beta-D-manno-heptose 1,7-bisphosphate 7-phosphatase n=1 Tax=Thiomicrorhabdus indica TaxID=2267253 RepID=UPI00102D85FA|nr:D-glycero-beta-D-manno-heptose 1,7-bisphosphate 7-phosphatase [Thiomicrorhabdus indica]